MGDYFLASRGQCDVWQATLWREQVKVRWDGDDDIGLVQATLWREQVKAWWHGDDDLGLV